VDLESGYSRKSTEIADHIKRLADLGVVGVNFEDSVLVSDRNLLDASDFAKILTEVNNILQKGNIDVFINVRTDSFLLGHSNAINESKRRIALYESAGADGIFTPCIQNRTDIEDIVGSTNLPINVLCMPDLPDFDTLNELGVKRISMGNFLFDRMYSMYEESTALLLSQRSFKSVF
jgi:2-methylisocitrate lyase-like PEP mutase family enzyme